jgi:hypothetical protein
MENTMNLFQSITLVSLAASLLLATPQDKQKLELEYVDKMGQESSALLLKTLGENLKQNIANGGVMKALSFCSNEAYTITEAVNKKLPNGITVKRISNKYRSPANAPKENEELILESLQKLKDANVLLPQQIVEKVDDYTYKYYKPLVIDRQLCLQCHGKLDDIDLKRAIAQSYPLDNAMNYEMNDLRGAVVVTIKRK